MNLTKQKSALQQSKHAPVKYFVSPCRGVPVIKCCNKNTNKIKTETKYGENTFPVEKKHFLVTQFKLNTSS